eukprot:1638684-Pyramimonas_sp.AAC.1
MDALLTRKAVCTQAKAASEKAAEWKRREDACASGHMVCEHCLETKKIEDMDAHLKKCSQRIRDPEDPNAKCKLPKPDKCTLQ